MSELHASEPQPPAQMPVAYECPECGQVWTVMDDAEEWAYGHDCEVDESPVRVIVPEERWVDDEEYSQIEESPGTDHGMGR